MNCYIFTVVLFVAVCTLLSHIWKDEGFVYKLFPWGSRCKFSKKIFSLYCTCSLFCAKISSCCLVRGVKNKSEQLFFLQPFLSLQNWSLTPTHLNYLFWCVYNILKVDWYHADVISSCHQFFFTHSSLLNVCFFSM